MNLLLPLMTSMLLISSIGFSQTDCKINSQGTFKPAFGPFKNNYKIIRTDSTQTDVDKIYGIETEFKIIWLDACSYQLKRIRGKITSGLKDFDLKDLVFKIDTTSESGFRYLMILKGTNTLLDTTRWVKTE